jgi:hypothetical protein
VWRNDLIEGGMMRPKNWRFVGVGTVLIVLSMAFFVAMMGLAPRSNDPVSLMRTVGEVVGVVAGISLAMIAVGLVGRRV